jgi:hypothetical protein
MAESTDSIKQTAPPKATSDPKLIREALLHLRQLAANLPPVDAVAIIRDIRESGTPTN